MILTLQNQLSEPSSQETGGVKLVSELKGLKMTPEINVTKRNGSVERFDDSKIIRAVNWACDGLEINPQDIMDKTYLLLRPNIQTSEIQKALIIATVDLYDIDCMDAAYAAARLQLLDLYKTVRNNLSIEDSDDHNMQYPHLREYLEAGVQKSVLNPELLTTFDLDKLNTAIEPKKDLLFQYLGLTTLIERYLIRTKGDRKVIELPQHFLMRVAMGIALAEPEHLRTEKAIEFYSLYKDLDYLSSTPTLFNSGTLHSQLSSCYVNHMSDSLSDEEELTQDNRYKSIMGTVDESARFSKYAGGIGVNVTSVRSAGSHIESTNGTSSGVIPYIKVLNNTLLAVNQGGKRPGSAAVYLEPWHADFWEFCVLRKEGGDDRLRAHDIYPASFIPDLFFKRLEDKESLWSFFSPIDVPELANTWGEEFERVYIEAEKAGKARFQKPTIEVWRHMLTHIYQTGFPWMTFKDNFNRRNPQTHAGMIRSSNLCCVAGDQLVTTDRGVFTAKELYEKGGENVVPGLSWYNKASAMLLPRPNAPMRLLKTKEGYTHKVTPDHRVWKVGYGWIEAQHLQEGDYLSIARKDSPFPGPDNHTKVSQADIDAVLDGGEIPANVYTASAGQLSKFLKGVVQPDETGFFEVKGLDKHILDKLQILFTLFTVKTIIQESAGGYVLMSSGNLTDAAIMLRQWGMRYNYNLLADDCLNDETRLMVKYIGYEELPNEDAYCLEVYGEVKYDPESPDKENDHAWVCNGLVTHNTEIALNTSEEETAVCNLGSINLARHVVDGKVDYEKLRKTVRTAVRMLDNVINVNFYPSKRAATGNLRHRPIGLGVMGYYEMLAKLNIRFQSNEHLVFTNELFEHICFYAIETSSELAVEKGSYESFEGSTWSKGILTPDTAEKTQYGFVTDLDWDGLREKVRKQGMRNSNLTSIAPTATISNIAGTTPCIEPPFGLKYGKKNLNGSFTIIDQSLRYLEPEQVETAFEVDQKWVVEAAAVRQRWIDQSQSVNIFLSVENFNRTGLRDAQFLSELYKKAWRLKLKSTYYLRNQSAKDAQNLLNDLEALKQRRKLQQERAQAKANTVKFDTSSIDDDFDFEPGVKACSIDNPDCESCQ